VAKLGTSLLEYVEVAPKVVCQGMNHLESRFQDIIDKGGEGVILRNPSAPYESGRSRNFLKHKVIYYCISPSVSVLFSFS